MNKAFPLDFVRQLIEQTLLEENIKDPEKYIGGKNYLSLCSFYEQLVQQDEVDRYTELYKDIIDQQNRTGLIANGVILAPENPTITNLNQCTIIPLSFTINFRCNLENRDNVLYTLNHMISLLKGRKFDIAEFDNGKLFKVGTFGNNVNGVPIIKNGDFLGFGFTDDYYVNQIDAKLGELLDIFCFEDGTENLKDGDWWYIEKEGKLCVVRYTEEDGFVEVFDDGSYPDIVFPPEHNSFDPYKISISFDSLRCDEPRTLNANEYCSITFGGSATISNAKIRFGNDILKLGFEKLLIKGNPDIEISDEDNQTWYWLEPLEIPSSNNANTKPIQLISNAFNTNSHTDSLNISLQYTFVVDTDIPLIKQFYDYARYGIQATIGEKDGKTFIEEDGITPNIIYKICELYNTWGNYEVIFIKAKVVESIEIENTESDVLSITIPFQIQGDNE